MSNYHFYFGGGFQVATGSSQTTDQRSRNYGHREIADSPQLRHVSPHSSNRNRSAVELLSRQEAKSRRSKHPRSRSRSKRIRKASSKSRSLSSEDRVQPAMHAPHLPGNSHHVPVHLFRGVSVCIHTINTHQHNPAISSMTERLTRGSGGSHRRARMHVPQLQQPLCFPMLQCL